MNLQTVTFAGADNSVDPGELVALSKKHPYVEWGILFSKNREGNYHFPRQEWIHRLIEQSKGQKVNLSMHLCGKWMKDLLQGDMLLGDLSRSPLFEIKKHFKRIQLNTLGQFCHLGDNFPAELKTWEKEVVVQYDNVNYHILDAAVKSGVAVSTLFDLSHGAGIVPESWPKQIPGLRCGYAGGLGPDNIREQLDKISAVVDQNPIWIDIEAKVRSHNDAVFDIDKVKQILDVIEKHSFIQPNYTAKKTAH
jgi:hypothetical protein